MMTQEQERYNEQQAIKDFGLKFNKQTRDKENQEVIDLGIEWITI